MLKLFLRGKEWQKIFKLKEVILIWNKIILFTVKSQHSCIGKVWKEMERKGKRNHNEVHIVIQTAQTEHGDSAKKASMKYDKSIKTTGRKNKRKVKYCRNVYQCFSFWKVTGCYSERSLPSSVLLYSLHTERICQQTDENQKIHHNWWYLSRLSESMQEFCWLCCK